jgi:hypothetical protein
MPRFSSPPHPFCPLCCPFHCSTEQIRFPSNLSLRRDLRPAPQLKLVVNLSWVSKMNTSQLDVTPMTPRIAVSIYAHPARPGNFNQSILFLLQHLMSPHFVLFVDALIYWRSLDSKDPAARLQAALRSPMTRLYVMNSLESSVYVFFQQPTC